MEVKNSVQDTAGTGWLLCGSNLGGLNCYQYSGEDRS